MEMKRTDHVKTAIRWRPPTDDREKAIEKVSENIVLCRKQNQTYVFDNIFDGSDQSEVYEVLMKPLVEKAIEGFDCTFIAYGQTGSGKTYTMGFEDKKNNSEHGIMRRLFTQLFSHENANKFKMTLSLVEIYNDRAFDLFDDNSKKPFFVKGALSTKSAEAVRKSVKNESEVQALISLGTKKRRSRCTRMNSSSSRSHAILTICLGIEHQDNTKRESVINLVDLAGTESQRQTGDIPPETQAEAKSINEGLLNIKLVIDAMVKGTHIPYRTSLITTVLQSSLKKESYLTLLGCISPYEDVNGGTLNTLRFVEEAKSLKKTPALNRILQDFKNSKTPVKGIEEQRSLYGNNSACKTPARFKRPLSTIQNSMTIPAKKLSKRVSIGGYFTRPPAVNSTSKKTNQFNQKSLFNSFSSQGKKPKTTATNLFPDNTAHDASMEASWINVTTSSVIEKDSIINQKPQVLQYIQHCEKILKTIQKIFYINESQAEQDGDYTVPVIPEINTTINALTSVPPTDDQNLHEILLTTTTCNVETNTLPLNYQPIETNEPIEYNSKLEVIKETSEISGMASVGNMVQNADQKSTISTNNVELSLNDYTKHAQYPSDASVENSEGIQALESTIDGDNNKISDCVPKLVIHKVRENDELSSSLYEVKKPDRNSPVVQSSPYLTNSAGNFSYSSVAANTEPSFGPLVYDSPEKDAFDVIASKTTQNYIRLPLSPRIILHRINNIQEYQQSLKRSPSHLKSKDTQKSKRAKVTQTKNVKKTSGKAKTKTTKSTDSAAPKVSKSKKPRDVLKTGTVKNRKPKEKTTEKSKPTEPNVANVPIVTLEVNTSRSENILRILNTGAVNDLKKLPQIGIKKAEQIFAYRGIHGGFDSIDDMMKMQFWSPKTHQRFLIHNLLV